MVIFNFEEYLAWLLGHLGGQHPKIIFSVIFGLLTINEETTFLKFQKNFFSLHPKLLIGHWFAVTTSKSS